MAEISCLLQIAKQAALDAGKAIMEIYEKEQQAAEIKPGGSPLTLADKRAHSIISERLDKTGLPVISEEGTNVDYLTRKYWDFFWLIDPLDGTKEFITRNEEFTVNIALVHENRPVAGVIYVPATGVLYSASKETGVYMNEERFQPLTTRVKLDDLLQKRNIIITASRSHMDEETKTFISKFRDAKIVPLGSSLKFMALLENRADIYPRLGPTMEWDTAAAHAILNISNRGVYRADLQSELEYNKPDFTNPSFIAF